ncbi:MAG: hypothetical protein ABW098_18735 [Candidatus Thiodiazotropha sp.]
MNKSAGQNKQARLKSRNDESHNPDSQIRALVKLLARRAAEIDFRKLAKREDNPNRDGEEQ